MVVRFTLPEGVTRFSQNQIRLARGVAFPTFQNLAQGEVRHWPEDQVDVVGHHDPVVQQIVVTMKVTERLGDHIGDVWPAQMTCTSTLIEMAFNLAAVFTVDFAERFRGCRSFQSPYGFGVFPLEAQQHLFRQRVGKSKRDEIRCSLPFDMRQVTARMNTTS